MRDKYILNERGEPEATDDLLVWGTWFEQSKNRVLCLDEKDGVKVSTVFLGFDHSFGEGSPILWETMIFGGEQDGFQDRYTSAEEAKLGHKKAMGLAGLI